MPVPCCCLLILLHANPCRPLPVQELLGGLWAYVRIEAVQEEEQLQLLSGACPSLAPLLPTAISLLALIQMAAGHLDHHHQHSHSQQHSQHQSTAAGQAKGSNAATSTPRDRKSVV